METEMVVCNIYKLFRSGNSFTKEGKKLERSNIAITRQYVDDQNYNWKDNGLWHEIDEEKTAEFYELKEKKRLLKVKNEKISKKVASNLANMLDIDVTDENVNDDAEVKEIKKPKKVTKQEKMKGIGDLKLAYLEKFGKHVPVNKKNDIDWILEKVNEEETEN